MTIVHELFHIWCIGNTNSDPITEETYGITQCAEENWLGCSPPQQNNPRVVNNAEHYAWYTEYGGFRERELENLCLSIQTT